MIVYLLVTDINPIPWQAPEASMGRNKSSGKNYIKFHAAPNLRAYQDALRESVELAYPDLEPFKEKTPLHVFFFYWRRLDQYRTQSGRQHTSHRADTSNLNKATEDAFQGLLYKNDVDNVTVMGRMMEQSIHAEPMLLVIATDEAPNGLLLSDDYINNVVLEALLEHHDPPTPPGNVRLRITT